MVSTVIARQQSTRVRTKVKTGCSTCRIRKVKCDESKPFCQRCVNSGRTCDGYESLFRNSTGKPFDDIQMGCIKSDPGLLLIQPTSTKVTSEEVDLLNRYFSIKTVFDVKLDCDEEARQVLQASLTDSSIQHAISSLRALRENFQTFRSSLESTTPQTLSYNYGLHQYSAALKGLMSSLSCPSSSSLKSALLCCHIFISIEQVQANYAAMAQHIIRGLAIMRAYRARPELSDVNELMLARHDQLPLLDVYIIKLFATPCKFAEPLKAADANSTTTPTNLISSFQQPVNPSNNRIIVPDMRTELNRIATSIVDFLDKVARVESAEHALRLLSERTALLHSLEVWFTGFELIWTETGRVDTEPVSMSFMRLFHVILEIILLGALKPSTSICDQLQAKNDRLQGIADMLSERLRDYSAQVRNGSNAGEQFKTR